MPRRANRAETVGWRAAAKARTARANENARKLAPIIKAIQAQGITTLAAIAAALNGRQGADTAWCWQMGGHSGATRVEADALTRAATFARRPRDAHVGSSPVTRHPSSEVFDFGGINASASRTPRAIPAARLQQMLCFVASGDFGQQPPPRPTLLKHSDFQAIFCRP
jgi:hypothetical protein